MSSKPLIILGSARKSSVTAQLITTLFGSDSIASADLLDYTITPYRYDGQYVTGDNFMELAELMLSHRKIVFATPVYWYSMSGSMKTFFDRLTDLVTIRKDIGRKFKGKQTYLIAVGADDALPAGFEEPFRLTSQYLQMEFMDAFYCNTSEIDVDSFTKVSFVLSILHS